METFVFVGAVRDQVSFPEENFDQLLFVGFKIVDPAAAAGWMRTFSAWATPVGRWWISSASTRRPPLLAGNVSAPVFIGVAAGNFRFCIGRLFVAETFPISRPRSASSPASAAVRRNGTSSSSVLPFRRLRPSRTRSRSSSWLFALPHRRVFTSWPTVKSQFHWNYFLSLQLRNFLCNLQL